MTFRDHFSQVSQDYAAYRPTYPDALFNWLGSVAPSRRLAWDCACGTGQATLGLARVFDRVIATDASAGQIAAASAHARVEYRVAAAEASGLDAGSADLVLVAQALHWFERDAFFREAARVFAPAGVLAVLTYGPLTVEGTGVNAIVQDYYHGVIGAYWPAERALVDSGYAGVELPFTAVAAPAFEMSAHWGMNDLLGYIGTWSATSRYRDATGIDPVPALAQRLARVWCDDARTREVVWPLTLKAGRKD